MNLLNPTRGSKVIWRQLLLTIAVASFSVAQPPSRIQSLISAGNLASLRWPNFRDYQPWLQKFYEPVNYAPAWVQGTSPSPQAVAMIDLFQDAWKKGLEPEDYDASRWKSRIPALQGSAADPADFDVSLTVCTMRYISDLHIGRINPHHFKFGLSVELKKYDLAQFLRERLLPASDLSAIVDGVEPPFPGYRRTRQALVHYTELTRTNDGEKLPVPAKPVEAGQVYPGMARLTHTLRLLGDLPTDVAEPADSQVYDVTLVEAVKRFQRRHGLEPDGRLGPTTLKQLNVPLSDRVRQLQLTLERWRWLPDEYSSPPIVVNIPDFRLRALDEGNKITREMRVVVGKAMRNQTPVFSRDMTHVVLRPYWNIPPGILRRDVLPAIKRDPNQIASKNYEITTNDGKVVTSGEVSGDVLAQLQAGRLAIRQKPGPTNALGLIKLMFPNEHHVYLHSTPASELFSRSRRDFSSGCIRVEEPAELAAWVLRHNSGWTVERVKQEMQNGRDNVTVSLARRVPVFIVYGTALAYENNEVHFYDDIYGHDKKLDELLDPWNITFCLPPNYRVSSEP